MPSLPAAAALTRLLARADRVADLLPRLHDHLVEVTGGRSSVLLQPEPRTGVLLATSGSHLDDLPRDGWLASPAEQRAVAQAHAGAAPVVIRQAAEVSPTLAARLGAPHALIVPLGDAQDPQGIALVGLDSDTPPGPPWDDTLAVADALVLALERARLRREADLQRAMRDLLDDFSRAASSAAALPGALGDVCRGASRLFSAEHATIWLHDCDARELVRAGAAGTGDDVLAGGALADAAAAALRGTARSSSIAGARGTSRGYTLAVPLRGRRRALGALVIEGVHLAPGGSLDVVERAEEAGRQLSAALENLQLIEQVRQSHRELEDTFNSLADLVLVCDTVQQVRQVNDAMAARVGRPPRELPGTAASRWLGPALCALIDDVAGGAGALVQQVEDERLGGNLPGSRLADPRGRRAAVRNRARGPGRHRAGPAPGGIARNFQRRLARSDKLAALGQFVAGMAHELNNPLAGRLGHVELLRARDAFPPVSRATCAVHREAERAAKIVRNLLVFSGSRRPSPPPAPATIVSRVIALRTRALRERNITLVREVHAPLPFLHADPLMLQQALLNIVLNAEQAVADHGRIGIAVGLIEPGMGRIDVRDSGPGIPPDILPHVFEPFFTTKDVGRAPGWVSPSPSASSSSTGARIARPPSRRRRRFDDRAPRRLRGPDGTRRDDERRHVSHDRRSPGVPAGQPAHRVPPDQGGQVSRGPCGTAMAFRKSDIDAWLESGSVRRPRDPMATPAPCQLARRAACSSSTTRRHPRLLTKRSRWRNTSRHGRRTAARRSTACAGRTRTCSSPICACRGWTACRSSAKRAASSAALKVIIITGYSSESSAIQAVNLGVSGYLTKPFRVPQVLSVVARAFGD